MDSPLNNVVVNVCNQIRHNFYATGQHYLSGCRKTRWIRVSETSFLHLGHSSSLFVWF